MDCGSEDKHVRLLVQDVMQLQKWKMIEYIVLIKWETRRIVASKAQFFTDHWLVMTYLRLPHRKESWKYENNFFFKGWSDEVGFGVEDISIEDITKQLLLVARALELESSGGRKQAG